MATVSSTRIRTGTVSGLRTVCVFPGSTTMPETGLNYNYYRDYDPATGRYVQSDPIGLNGGSFVDLRLYRE